jgi:tRNA A-37 threonylcarbamoyl transferase component Bud32
MVPVIGEVVGNYVLERLVDQGAMGAVYLARHPRLGRQVAIKMLHSHRVIEPVHVKRFATEAVAASRIGNQHIVEVLDFGQRPDGTPYLVMEWLDGETLGARLDREGKLPRDQALGIAAGIGAALAACHSAGIIHRDLKPDNIFLCRRDGQQDFVKVLDFGLCKLTDAASERLSMTGETVGTPAYMSPEQCAGDGTQVIDHRADIYALGLIVYRMLLGQTPYRASGVGSVLVAHMMAAPQPPRRIDPDLPVHIERALLQALEKDPRHRPRSVGELIEALQGHRSLPRPPGAPGSRSLGRWGAAGLGLLVLGGGVWWWLRNPSRPVLPGAAPSPAAVAAAAPGPDAAAPPARALDAGASTGGGAGIADAAVARLHLEIHARPADATVLLDGQEVANPFDGRVGRGRHQLRVTAAGHRAEESWFELDADREILISLERERAAAGAGARSRRASRPRPPAAPQGRPASPRRPPGGLNLDRTYE